MSHCTAAFGTCGGGDGASCCAPLRCFRQSPYYSQCGTACPADPQWECHTERVGIILSRWGSWPAWTPLLLHTLRAVPAITFLLITDALPGVPLPPNVQLFNLTTAELLTRAQLRIGSKLTRLGGGKFASGVSAAKVNDLKPMFGEIFADLLADFGWWGTLQEDVVVGDLTMLLPADVRRQSDVIAPSPPSGNQTANPRGVAMLYRNTREVNTLWPRRALRHASSRRRCTLPSTREAGDSLRSRTTCTRCSLAR